MGVVLSALFGPNLRGFHADWDNLKPSPEDQGLYDEVNTLFELCSQHLESVKNYTNCADVIRTAMQADPGTPEAESADKVAFEAVKVNAEMCYDWMLFAKQLANIFNKKLLTRLCEPLTDDEQKSDPPSEVVVLSHQALTKQLVMLLDFAITFDQEKMMQSSIQNDFSFYRRVYGKVAHLYDADQIRVDLDTAAQVSMFLAEATPFLKDISKNVDAHHLNTLGQACNACLDLLRAEKFDNNSPNNRLALRGMVAAFIIYDNANGAGGFQRTSVTRGVKVCQMVGQQYRQRFPDFPEAEINGLKGLLKFGTIHFSDAPRAAEAALAD